MRQNYTSTARRLRAAFVATALGSAVLLPLAGPAQDLLQSWNGYSHDPQHTCLSRTAAQPLNRIHWHTPVDQMPQYQGNDLLIHYGTPLITARNTLILPVKTTATGGFQFQGRRGSDGTLLWTQNTDYVVPPHDWVPSCAGTLTPSQRLYLPGAGGTVYYRDVLDSTASNHTGQLAFYGLANYQADPSAYNGGVFISTPITSDSQGNIYFGYFVNGATPINLPSGIARISSTGVGTFMAAPVAAGDNTIAKVVYNCAPALSNDQKTLYVAVSDANGSGAGFGYLLALDSSTLTLKSKVRLKDVKSGQNAFLPDNGTASPLVAPNGDVYFGVLEDPFPANHDRGWLLHFNATLSQTMIPGAFGWDDTPSIVPASAVPSYTGGPNGKSTYLLMAKYNNYAGVGGNGINKLAVLDPLNTEIDPISGATTMNEVLTVTGVTIDSEFGAPAVREWCINSAAIDPFTKSAMVNSEDGKLYRWDFTTNTLQTPVVLTPGIGEAYTPTLIGPDGTVYAINNATLFAVGR